MGASGPEATLAPLVTLQARAVLRDDVFGTRTRKAQQAARATAAPRSDVCAARPVARLAAAPHLLIQSVLRAEDLGVNGLGVVARESRLKGVVAGEADGVADVGHRLVIDGGDGDGELEVLAGRHLVRSDFRTQQQRQREKKEGGKTQPVSPLPRGSLRDAPTSSVHRWPFFGTLCPAIEGRIIRHRANVVTLFFGPFGSEFRLSETAGLPLAQGGRESPRRRRDRMRAVFSLALTVFLLGSGSALAADGAALYTASCASCHGADGKADSTVAKAMNVPPVAGTTLSPEEVVKKVQASDKHKAAVAKLSPEELDAIARALPGGS